MPDVGGLCRGILTQPSQPVTKHGSFEQRGPYSELIATPGLHAGYQRLRADEERCFEPDVIGKVFAEFVERASAQPRHVEREAMV